MTEDINFEAAKRFLPSHLAGNDLHELYAELRRLDNGIRYYSPIEFDFYLQGDTFEGAPYLVVTNAKVELRETRVMILSNTCDISHENNRAAPVHVTIAPVVRVSRWRERLISHGLSSEVVGSKIEAAKLHRTSNIFYLAAGQGVTEESFVLFDHMQSMPRSRFEQPNAKRLATLSQAAFWLLLLKLSIHFCRQQEAVNRKAV